METFEQGFVSAERGADNATKSVAKVLAQTRAMQKAARLGDLHALRLALNGMTEQLSVLIDEVAAAQQSWHLSEETEQSYLQEGYKAELMRAAEAAGVRLFERD